MRERQPGVQRDEAGLGAGAGERKDEDQRRQRAGGMRGADGVERIVAAGPREQAEGQQ